MTALLSDIFQVRQDTTLFRDNGEAYNHVCKKVQEFSSLEDNWDSYEGLAPTKAALLGAQQLASAVFNDDVPRPYVFPVPNGSVQIQWSCRNLEVEIEVVSFDKIHLYLEDLTTGFTIEEECTIDFSAISNAVADLASRPDNNSTSSPNLTVIY